MLAKTSGKTEYVSRDNEMMSLSVLLHSRTVVEKADFVSTGVLTYVLGDLIEIEIAEYELFKLGDEVKVISYTPAGITVFRSKVVAKDPGAIMIFNPPDVQKKFGDKRSYPRVTSEHRGDLTALIDLQTNEKHFYELSQQMLIHNISSVGIGFKLLETTLLQNGAVFQAELDLGFHMTFEAEIMRRDNSIEGPFYGARFLRVGPAEMMALRGFILKRQLQDHFQAKKDALKKRSFK